MPRNPDRLKLFSDTYGRKLEEEYMRNPGRYAWPVSKLPEVVSEMTKAVESNNFIKDGPAVQATIKQLGINDTYKAINAWLDAT